MFIPDTHVWAALAVEEHQHHGAASEWFNTVDAAQTVHFCRVTQQGLMRLLTRRAILAAFAITAGATFVTIDRAFTQLPALDLQLIE